MRKLEILDTYGSKFDWHVDNKAKNKSLIGVVATVLMVLLILAYLAQRIAIMRGYRETSLTMTQQLDVLSYDHTLGK